MANNELLSRFTPAILANEPSLKPSLSGHRIYTGALGKSHDKKKKKEKTPSQPQRNTFHESNKVLNIYNSRTNISAPPDLSRESFISTPVTKKEDNTLPAESKSIDDEYKSSESSYFLPKKLQQNIFLTTAPEETITYVKSLHIFVIFF